MTDNLISINNLSKKYIVGNNEISILKEIDFNLSKGDIISICGPSGSGKSTFLNILGLLDTYYDGNYTFLKQDTSKLSFNKKNFIRNKSIGFVHQFFHLIPELNVLENISLPSLIKDDNYKISREKAKNLIVNIGLENKINSNTLNLSGGEQQRVAIARALINDPEIVIADEMTGNLDEKTADSVFDFFIKTIRFNNQSLIFVTHNMNYAKKADKIFKITNNKLEKLL